VGHGKGSLAGEGSFALERRQVGLGKGLLVGEEIS
jgi:hypothetical protein